MTPSATCSELAEKEGGELTVIVIGMDTVADAESVTVNVS
jgi:hypothetical protein